MRPAAATDPGRAHMKYWDEFHKRDGFNDGDSIPNDALASRTATVFAYNTLAAALGATTRLMPVDRAGMHNPYLLGCVAKRVADLFAEATESWQFAENGTCRMLAQGETCKPDERIMDLLSNDNESVHFDGPDCFVNARNQIAKRGLERVKEDYQRIC